MINKSALVRRYRDAYGIARGTNTIGKIVQIVGLVFALGVGGISALVGLSLGGISGEAIGALLMAALGGVVGIIPGAFISLIGVLLSANGQMLLATLDGTVASSPFLDDADKVGMMHLQAAYPQASSSPTFTPPPLPAQNPVTRDNAIEPSWATTTNSKTPSDEEVTQNVTEACITSFGIEENQMRSSFDRLRIPPGNVQDLLDSIDERFGYYIPPIDRDTIRCPADIIAIILKTKS